MGFAHKSGLYRRHVHLWHILSGTSSLLAAYFIMGRKSDIERDGKRHLVFGECLTNAIVFILAFALNFGMVMWVTFVAGIVMFKNLPRMTFGQIQSKLFPLYFLIGAITGFVMLTIAVYSARNIEDLSWKEETVMVALVAIFFPNMVNGIFLGPRSTAIMFERHRMVKEAGDEDLLKDNSEYKAIKKQFGMMHGISSLLNLIALGGSFYVLYWISSLVHELSGPKL